MRRALEEDQYSAQGSIVDTDSDEEDDDGGRISYLYKGQPIRLDRAAMQHRLWTLVQAQQQPTFGDDDEDEKDPDANSNEKHAKSSRKKNDPSPLSVGDSTNPHPEGANNGSGNGNTNNNRVLDGGSIFGQPTGSSSNSTWVECDKCKKWRRLRGVVDEKKLPARWYCSMNKNDPEHNRCSAPEEDYTDTGASSAAPTMANTPADIRTRKHLRVWVRRLQGQEAYEARQPTTWNTRNKPKRNSTGQQQQNSSTCKDPYDWIQCANPNCGKWRALLRSMDIKTFLASGRAWYCVMNTWDEKCASCAAPQEDLPTEGLPPWVMKDAISEKVAEA